MWRVMGTTRVVLFARPGAARDCVRASLEARGAEVVLVADDVSATIAMGTGSVAGMIVDLDPTPSASGLGVLLAARELVPRARRVLMVDARASIADAAVAAGLVDRLLFDGTPVRRIEALADWLVTLCEHAPRRAELVADA